MSKLERKSVPRSKSLLTTKSVLGGQVQAQWLAVLPYRLELTRPLLCPTLLYFQKNYQILGDLKRVLPPSSIPTVYGFNSPDQLIAFRLFSLSSLSYKWSLYRRHDSGQQEFLESAVCDLQPVVEQWGLREDGGASVTPQQLNVWFGGTGVRLSFLLLVAEEMGAIESQAREFLSQQKSSHQANGEKQSTPPTPKQSKSLPASTPADNPEVHPDNPLPHSLHSPHIQEEPTNRTEHAGSLLMEQSHISEHRQEQSHKESPEVLQTLPEEPEKQPSQLTPAHQPGQPNNEAATAEAGPEPSLQTGPLSATSWSLRKGVVVLVLLLLAFLAVGLLGKGKGVGSKKKSRRK